MFFSEKAMQGYWTDALRESKENCYWSGEACLEAYSHLANDRQAKFKEAEDSRQMNKLRAKAVEYEKFNLGRKIACFRACANKARSNNKLKDAAVMDVAIARSEELITMIDQVLQKLDESENLSNEKCGDETTWTA